MKNTNPIKINILFGLDFDQSPVATETDYPDYFQYGPSRLLQYLEAQLGLGLHAVDVEPLRIEFYFNVITNYLKDGKAAFFKASFNVDPLSTAQTLLAWREELLGMGYDFMDKNAPQRLSVFNELEKIANSESNNSSFYKGVSERWNMVIAGCKAKGYCPNHIVINEPLHTYPIQLQRLLKVWNVTTENEIRQVVNSSSSTNLTNFQDFIQASKTQSIANKDDKSIVILQAKRDADLAVALSKLMANHPQHKYEILLQQRNKTLENALAYEGCPRLGVSVQSVAHPLTQILKLMPHFLYSPLDPKVILEFLSLNFKPLDARLSLLLARALADIPGVNSEKWLSQLQAFWTKNAEYLKYKDPVFIKSQYDFLFNRKHYDYNEQIPKDELILMYRYLLDWLQDAPEIQQYNTSKSLIKQTEQLLEYFEFSSIEYFYRIDIERTIKLIFQPIAVRQGDKEVEATTVYHAPGQFFQPHERLIFGDFIHKATPVLAQKWNAAERAYFKEKVLDFDTPTRQNNLNLYQRNQPIMMTRTQLILALPSTINGDEVEEHHLMADLRACFSNWADLVIKIDENTDLSYLQKTDIEVAAIEKTSPTIELEDVKSLKRDIESPTGLEDLMFYPHIYAFRYAAKLNNNAINSVARMQTMKGNLAHKCFELALNENIETWTNKTCFDFVQKNMTKLLETDGVPLLLYGNNPEREAFIRTLKDSLWQLISSINNNNWKVVSTEQSVENQLFSKKVNGRIDLLLQRGTELAVVDFKWGSKGRFEDKIKNKMAVQLAMYAKLIGESKQIHTAYYLINHQRILAFNRLAFKEADLPGLVLDSATVLAEMHDKIEKTLAFRFGQLAKGIIEVRTEQTALALEDIYQTEDIDIDGMYEMPSKTNEYDAYKSLIVN